MTDTYRTLGNPVDERTPKLNLPLPHLLNDTRDDVPRLRTALANVDAALNTLNLAVAQNAAVSATKAPLTGGGASGTWDIQIGRSAMSIRSVDTLKPVTDLPDTWDNGLSVRLVNNMVGYPAGAYSGLITSRPWTVGYGTLQLNHAYNSGISGIWYRQSTDGSGNWTTWRKLVDSVNIATYAPSLTGAGASGAWGISVTGTSAGAPWSGITGKPAVIAAGADAQAARAAIGAGTLSPYQIIVITANTTAQANTHYVIGTAGITLTLPVSVSDGDYFGISEAINSGSYAIDFGSIKLRGQTKGLQSIDANGSGANFKYKDATRGFV